MAHSGKTMTFATDLVPQENNIYNLGQENLKWIIRGSLPLSDITGADDLKAIEAISGTTGLLKKIAANTWTLDTNSKVTIAGNEVSLGGSLSDSTLRESLGLSNALHFIGITSTTLTNGSTTATLTPKTENPSSLSKTTGFVDGDVVMDGDQLREYVWSGSAWRLLGITTSTAYTQPTSTATNTWIAQVSQGTDGKITATTGSLNTSGTWSGIAAKATAANLTTTTNALAYYTNQTGTFGNASKITVYNDVDITVQSATKKRNGIRLSGTCYGNTASDLTSNTAGVMRYEDGGVRIEFSADSSDNAALLYTNHDSANTGGGSSFHFVGQNGSNNTGGNLAVTAPDFVARRRMAVGYNFTDTNYALKVTGASLFTGNFEVRGNTIRLRNANNDNNQAGTAPYVTSLLMGDGPYVAFNEFHDDWLAIQSRGLVLNVRSSPIAVYDATKTYAVGNVVWYDKNYYICNTAITTAEAWTAGHWSLRNPSGAILSEGSIIPWANNTYTLGNSSYKWSTIYATTFSGNATSANYINLYEARGTTTTLNKTANYVAAGAMFHLIASSNTSATDHGKTPTDANILQMNWDNNGGYDAQLGIATGVNRMYFRARPSSKTAWDEVAHAPVGTAGVGNSTQPVYMTSEGVITACTSYANASVNYATSAGSATTANTATSLTNFVVSTYTLAANKGVRIKYPAFAPVLISCQRSTGGSRLILIGGGYGEEGTVRNDFTEVVSPSESHFTWSMPQTTGYACTIEIMHHDTSGTATVWVESTAACTFTEITALTSTKTNRNLLHSANTYAGTNATANMTWGGTYTLARINGTDIKVTMPSNPNTNTTYTFAEGSTNGAFSVTPSGGSAQSVTIHGLAALAYIGTGSDATKYLNNKGEWTTPPNDNTHYTTKLIAGGSSATSNAAVSSGNVYLRLFDDSTHRNNIQLKPGNNMTITSDASGIITFAATDTTYSTVSKTEAGLCPQLPNETTTTKFLRQDGSWVVPPDTHYTTHLYVNATAGGATNNAATANTTTYMHLYDNTTKRETIQFKGSGATTVTATGGVITINSTDNNTDTKVSQSVTTTANWRKVLLHHKDDTSSTATETDQTDVVYGAQYISAQPSTGTLRANAYRVTDNVTLQWNDTDQSLDFIFA